MNDRAWVATRTGRFEWRRDGGTAWRSVRTGFLGEPVSMLLPRIDGSVRMLAALNRGYFGVKVHAADDAGKIWTDVATPTDPDQAADDKRVAWKLVQIWSLAAAHGVIWAGPLPGGLFKSIDGAASWQLVESPWRRSERVEWFGGGYEVPGIHSICPHPTRPAERLVGISCGGVWFTRDGAADWSLRGDGLRADFMPPERKRDPSIQDVHLVARCAASPDGLWCQHHNGIWRSIDGARSWHEVERVPRSNFGFALAAHPGDPDTAWFGPGVADQCRVPVDNALAVNRTRDGGRSFETLREGLPQQHCYDLVYRQGLAVGADDTTLLMGSTTGALWASRDGADSGSTISLHVPPVYAVRFG